MKKAGLIFLAVFLAYFIYSNYDFRDNIIFKSTSELEEYLNDSYIEDTLQVGAFSKEKKILKIINGVHYYAIDGTITAKDYQTDEILWERHYDLDIVDFYDDYVLGYSDGIFKIQKEEDLLVFTGEYLDSYYNDGYLYLALKNSFYAEGIFYPSFFYKKNYVMKDRIFKLSKNYNYGISLYIINEEVSYNHFLGMDGKIDLGKTTWISFDKYKYKIHFDGEMIIIADRKKV